MIPDLLDWLDHRTGYKEVLSDALYERVPGGARWRYIWGSTLVFTFFVQVITGFFLWAAYCPSAQTAWESVYFIQEVMFLGWLVRGIHHYAAQLMIVLMGVHLIQVVVDGAYRAPREINFWLGLILMQIVLGLSLTGYLLPWDQKGYYATQVATNIVGSAPVVGPQVQQLVQGGTSYGHHTLTRFFALHAGLLPVLLVGFLVLHVAFFRRHGLTARDPERAPDVSFWPDQVLREAVACLVVLAVVLLLAIFAGADLSAPADPTEDYAAARPEWYFLSIFRFLKFEAIEQFGVAFGAIYIPGIIMGIITLFPLIALMSGGHRFNVIFMSVLAVAIAGLTVLSLYEDSNNPDHQAALTEADRDGHRARELAAGPEKIPIGGAVQLMRADPFTRGPRIFAEQCASCHRYNGHNGRGSLVTLKDRETEEITVVPLTAADLGNFGSKDWMRAVVCDYQEHFKAWRNTQWFKNAEADGDTDEILNPEASEMADWSGDQQSLLSEENSDNLNALIEFLVSETGRSDMQLDSELVATGRKVATTGSWLGALEGTACTDCHASLGDEYEEGRDGDGYPDIAKYGSAMWLKSFISNPGSPQHYGDKNQMPTFEGRLSEDDLELLVRWMVKDYPPNEVEDKQGS